MIGLLSFIAMLVGIGLLLLDMISIEVFDVIFAIAMGNTALALMAKAGIRNSIAKPLALAIPVVALSAQLIFPEIRLSPYLAVVIINAFVAYVFGRGWITGRTPLIVQLIRISDSGPEGSRAFQNYVVGQGRVWTVFGAVTSVLGLVAMIVPALRESLGPTISTFLALQIVWFVLAHHWARLRYERPETWMGTLRLMSRNDTWSELEI